MTTIYVLIFYKKIQLLLVLDYLMKTVNLHEENHKMGIISIFKGYCLISNLLVIKT